MSDSRKEEIDKLVKENIPHQNLTKEELQETYRQLAGGEFS